MGIFPLGHGIIKTVIMKAVLCEFFIYFGNPVQRKDGRCLEIQILGK